MKTIIQIDERQPQDPRFFERRLQRALEGFEELATHASLKLSREQAEAAGSDSPPADEQPPRYSCRIALAFRNWGIVVAESSAEKAALAMDRALHQVRLAAQQVVLPESRSTVLSRHGRFVCC